MHAVLTSQQLHSFGVIPENLTLEEAIIRVADMHGYTVAKWGNTFALSKRYDEPEDLPDPSLDEMTASMDNVVNILKSYGAHGQTNTDLMAEIFGSLSASQIQQLPKRTLTVSALSPHQRELVSEGATRIYAGSRSQEADDVDYRLRHIAGASLGLVEQPVVARIDQAQAGGILIRLTGEGTTRQIGRSLAGGLDHAADLDNEKAAVKTLADTIARKDATVSKATDTSTLETIAAKLSENGHTRYAVDPELKTRKAALFGIVNASGDSAFRALAYACGLSIRADDKKTELRIVRMRALMPTSIAGLPTAVRRALPDTFLRACGVTGVRASNTYAAVPSDRSWLSANGLSPKAPVRSETGMEMSSSWLLQAAATRRIKACLVVMLKKRKPLQGSALPLKESELGDDTTSAIGALILAEFIGHLDGVLPIRQQDFIARFDDDILGGGVRIDDRGRRKLDLEFLVAQPGSTGAQFEAAIGDVLAPATLPIDEPNAGGTE